METKFEIRTKFNRGKLAKINRTELKIMRSILLILFGAGAVLSIVNLILQALYGAILSQDIKNLIIAVSGLAAAFFLSRINEFYSSSSLQIASFRC